MNKKSNESYSDLHSYANYVKTLARSKSKKIVPNGLPEHARVINSNLLDHAEKEMLIFSGNLRNDIYGDEKIIASLMKFIDKKAGEKAKIKILLQDIDDEKSDIYGRNTLNSLKEVRRFIEVCVDNAKDRLEIKKCSGLDRGIKKHFTIMDEVGYRYCPDKDVTEAIACFNDSETALHLKSQFNILFQRATEIPGQ